MKTALIIRIDNDIPASDVQAIIAFFDNCGRDTKIVMEKPAMRASYIYVACSLIFDLGLWKSLTNEGLRFLSRESTEATMKRFAERDGVTLVTFNYTANIQMPYSTMYAHVKGLVAILEDKKNQRYFGIIKRNIPITEEMRQRD